MSSFVLSFSDVKLIVYSFLFTDLHIISPPVYTLTTIHFVLYLTSSLLSKVVNYELVSRLMSFYQHPIELRLIRVLSCTIHVSGVPSLFEPLTLFIRSTNYTDFVSLVPFQNVSSASTNSRPNTSGNSS